MMSVPARYQDSQDIFLLCKKSHHTVKLLVLPIDFFNFVRNYQCVVNIGELGTQIKERRKVLGITQQELADLAGISINTVVPA